MKQLSITERIAHHIERSFYYDKNAQFADAQKENAKAIYLVGKLQATLESNSKVFLNNARFPAITLERRTKPQK